VTVRILSTRERTQDWQLWSRWNITTLSRDAGVIRKLLVRPELWCVDFTLLVISSFITSERG
jgi:hypothetical protein